MRAQILMLFCLITGLVWPVFAEPLVNLTITEKAGIARTAEPVLTGVPLPDGLISDTGELALKDAAGNVIPCDFRAASKWWTDKRSIRWLHVDFKTDIAASAGKTLTLWRDPASHAVAGTKLAVTDLGSKFQVTTGPLRFTVKKKAFNLFDEVWVDETGASLFDDAHKVVASHANGGFSLLSGGPRYYSSNDSTASAAVLEQSGPLSCVIRLEGRLRNPAGATTYYFICRITAYDNSKIVNVQFSFENRDPDVSKFVSMYGLNLELPLTLDTKQFGLGSKKGAKTGTLGASDTAYLYAGSINQYRFGGVLSDSGIPKNDQCPDMGMAWLTDGQKGAGVSTQWFWQMYPASVEVTGSGLMNLGLFSHRFRGGSADFPPRFPNHYDIYSGMGRTHEVRFVFFNNDSSAEIRSQLAGANSRLYALAPAAWFCRGTQAFGPLVEKGNTSLFTTTNWDLIKTTETAMWNAALKCVGNTNIELGGKDAYDYLCWGDNPHYLESPGRLLYNGNYYDLPHLMFQHFARTLDYRILDYVLAHSAHVRDLHQIHLEPGDGNDGACRYCPPTNHIGQDDLAPAFMNQTSHHKTQCLFERYYLVGDRYALDVALKGVNWIRKMGTAFTDASNINCYARRPGNNLNTLIAGYKYNFDATCLTNIISIHSALRQNLAGGGIDLCGTADQKWMTGLLLEPLVDAAQMTGNELFSSTVKQIVDSTGSGMNSNVAYAAAYLASHYNNPTYLYRANSLMNMIGNGMSFQHHEKDYVEQSRSVLMSFYYFAIPDSAKGVRLEDGLPSCPPLSPVCGYPNPFNPSVNLRIDLKNRGSGNALLAIYRADGRKVFEKTLPEGALNRSAQTVSWNSCDQAGQQVSAGVYVVKIRRNGFSAEDRITLLK